ncbi:unnamed protein product [Rangifer tarandus platyrhynchus]|uniref:Uncharacterized protein n=2 Tax=Rangifer tarandus platyrhynchus TaxID=3082113 RepID=A0ABN8ZSP8_RANTA|nr:unnamed protein product [Rangifer tarandus platyrhynchus]CAI9706798.1 unnamed protein product [Rangifer tarandus platyrhynchus]
MGLRTAKARRPDPSKAGWTRGAHSPGHDYARRIPKDDYKAQCANPYWFPRLSQFLESRHRPSKAACTAHQGPFLLLLATPRQSQGRARPIGIASLSEPSPQQGPFEHHAQMNCVDSASPEPSKATLRRTDRAGPRPSFGDSGRSPGIPPGNRVFTLPRVMCRLQERK